MELGTEILNRIGHWGSLSRWERSEVGRDLRRLGMSYGEIISLIDVKKSTLATWCPDVELTENQILGIKERTGIGRRDPPGHQLATSGGNHIDSSDRT